MVCPEKWPIYGQRWVGRMVYPEKWPIYGQRCWSESYYVTGFEISAKKHSESQISSRQYTISGCIAISNKKYTFAFKEVKHV